MDEDSLFGDLRVLTVSSSPQTDVVGERIREAWSLWSSLTSRPPTRDPDRLFEDACRKAINGRMSAREVTRCIHAAARVQPVVNRDPRDVKRVIRVLTNSGYRAEALSLYGDEEPVIPYPEADELEVRSTLRDLAAATGIPTADLTAAEREAAGLLIAWLDPDELGRAVRRVKLLLGEDQVFPSEVIRNAHVWRGKNPGSVKVAVNPNRDPYAGGDRAARELDGAGVDADSGALKLLSQGCPVEVVATYNSLAPEGYWNAVTDLIAADDDLDRKGAYDQLQDGWGWHPREREVPRW